MVGISWTLYSWSGDASTEQPSGYVMPQLLVEPDRVVVGSQPGVWTDVHANENNPSGKLGGDLLEAQAFPPGTVGSCRPRS